MTCVYFIGSSSSYTLSKNHCSKTTCGGNYSEATPCSTSDGCANEGTESIVVTCAGSYSDDSASGSMTHSITFSSESPAFSVTNLDGEIFVFVYAQFAINPATNIQKNLQQTTWKNIVY